MPKRPPRLVVVPWLGPQTRAITLGRIVLIRSGDQHDAHLIAHEMVHVVQWERLGWWQFLRGYLGAYVSGRRRGLTHWQAYATIPLEVQARALADEIVPLSQDA